MFDFDDVFNNATVLSNKNISLRLLDEKDIDDIYSILSNPEVLKYDKPVAITSKKQAKNFIDGTLSCFYKKYGIRYAIVANNTQKVVGTCGFLINKTDAWARIGFMVAQEFWQKGYGYNAVKLMCDYLLGSSAIIRIEAYVLPKNIASQKLLIKCGFVCNCLVKKYMYFKNKHHDMLLFSLVK